MCGRALRRLAQRLIVLRRGQAYAGCSARNTGFDRARRCGRIGRGHPHDQRSEGRSCTCYQPFYFSLVLVFAIRWFTPIVATMILRGFRRRRRSVRDEERKVVNGLIQRGDRPQPASAKTGLVFVRADRQLVCPSQAKISDLKNSRMSADARTTRGHTYILSLDGSDNS